MRGVVNENKIEGQRGTDIPCEEWSEERDKSVDRNDLLMETNDTKHGQCLSFDV